VYLCVLCGSENKQRLFPYTQLTVFRTYFSYIKDVYVFRELVFSRLILVYFAYLHIKIHNMDHTISEYRLLYGPFHLYNSHFVIYDACKKLSLCFQFWKTNIFFKNVVNMGNKLPNHIKVGRQCVILELVEILPVCNIHFVMWCNMWLIIGIQISFQIKRGFMYYFIHCSCKYMEHVNYSQLTVTPSVFEKYTNYEQNKT